VFAGRCHQFGNRLEWVLFAPNCNDLCANFKWLFSSILHTSGIFLTQFGTGVQTTA
jgi:hypothetical protein